MAPAAPIPPRWLRFRTELNDPAQTARAFEEEWHSLGIGTLDLVLLGCGEDGHTASLLPGDEALRVVDADVAASGPYKGRRRMTLTFPAIDRARCILWLVTGSGKCAALERLRAGDRSIPAGRVRSDRAVLLADDAAGRGG